MAIELKPVSDDYMLQMIHLEPGDRLHRLVARLFDTYYDDLTEANILEMERLADRFRLTHADGKRLS